MTCLLLDKKKQQKHHDLTEEKFCGIDGKMEASTRKSSHSLFVSISSVRIFTMPGNKTYKTMAKLRAIQDIFLPDWETRSYYGM